MVHDPPSFCHPEGGTTQWICGMMPALEPAIRARSLDSDADSGAYILRQIPRKLGMTTGLCWNDNGMMPAPEAAIQARSHPSIPRPLLDFKKFKIQNSKFKIPPGLDRF
jgi:hypothetical protein